MHGIAAVAVRRHEEERMTVVEEQPLTEEQLRELVIRAGMLLRFRPVPGSDPKQAALWLQSVAEYLASEALRRVLAQLGVEPPTDLTKPVVDQAPVFDHLTKLIDTPAGHEDNPILLAVAGGVAAAYLGLVTYAIYWNVTQGSGEAGPDAGTPDGGAPDGGAPDGGLPG